MLAQHYGFTEEELDFIINYDIKYPDGMEADEEDDGECAVDSTSPLPALAGA